MARAIVSRSRGSNLSQAEVKGARDRWPKPDRSQYGLSVKFHLRKNAFHKFHGQPCDLIFPLAAYTPIAGRLAGEIYILY